MNKYILVLSIPIIATIVSYIKENNKPIFKIKKEFYHYPVILSYRYIHFVIYAYFAIVPFLVPVEKINNDINMYIVASFFLIFTWMFMDICFLALSELNHYEIKNIYSLQTSFHPGLNILFGDSCYIINIILGFLFFINISRIIYYYPFGSIVLKILFSVFIYVGIVKNLLNKQVKKKYCKSIFNDFIIKYM